MARMSQRPSAEREGTIGSAPVESTSRSPQRPSGRGARWSPPSARRARWSRTQPAGGRARCTVARAAWRRAVDRRTSGAAHPRGASGAPARSCAALAHSAPSLRPPPPPPARTTRRTADRRRRSGASPRARSPEAAPALACRAELGAQPAEPPVHGRVAEHEVRRRAAAVGAVEQQGVISRVCSPVSPLCAQCRARSRQMA
jgi:hypothetical protein